MSVLVTLRRRIVALLAVLVGSAGAVTALVAGPVPQPRSGNPVGAAAGGDQFGDAADFGSMAGKTLAQPIVGMAASPTGRGYWLVARDGGIFSFGDARFLGSTGAVRLNQPIVGMSSTPSGAGYFFVASDGGIFSFGDAKFRGSTGAVRLAQPIVAMATTPTGGGYWLAARDGGIFTFGDAGFFGADAGRLSTPVVALGATPSGRGYWLLTADGRVHNHGDAVAAGSAVGTSVSGFARTPSGRGYWIASSDGSVKAFGDAARYAPSSVNSKIVGIAPTPTGQGYWLATSSGAVLSHAVVEPAPAPVLQASGPYSFLATDRNGHGMRYNPCAPVRYVINPDGAPTGMVGEVQEAFRRLSSATGIDFTYAGSTTEAHLAIGGGAQRRSYQPDRYGAGQWAPILISWTTPTTEPILSGSTLGYGGSTSYWLSNTDQAYVTGEVVFDRDLRVLRAGFGTGLTRGNLAQHEIAHVAGLDHVQDRSQVMYPSLSTQTPDGYGPGDRTGLAQLGQSAGCLNVALPPS